MMWPAVSGGITDTSVRGAASAARKARRSTLPLGVSGRESSHTKAVGIIRSRSGASAEEAFDRLAKLSQAENVKLVVIAERLVDEAVRRAKARRSGSA